MAGRSTAELCRHERVRGELSPDASVGAPTLRRGHSGIIKAYPILTPETKIEKALLIINEKTLMGFKIT